MEETTGVLCATCGEMVPAGRERCENCGHDVARSRGPTGRVVAGLHPLAPAVFVVVALATGVLVAAVVSLALGIPAGLLGGGIGVWMLERGRRVL